MKRIFTPAKKKSILIVDDDPFATQIYREKLEAQGFKVEVTPDFDSTLQTLKKEVFDLLILDLCLPGINVVELIRIFVRNPPRSPYQSSFFQILISAT